VSVEIRRHAELRCFPSVDETFTEFVFATASRLSTGGSEVSCTVLEESVRLQYPAAAVHPQTQFATMLPGAPVWYVFRDGAN
jgi:hypothetical protein